MAYRPRGIEVGKESQSSEAKWATDACGGAGRKSALVVIVMSELVLKNHRGKKSRVRLRHRTRFRGLSEDLERQSGNRTD
jgi:hypothetical protein